MQSSKADFVLGISAFTDFKTYSVLLNKKLNQQRKILVTKILLVTLLRSKLNRNLMHYIVMYTLRFKQPFHVLFLETVLDLEVFFCTKFRTFWKPFSTKCGSFWHANFGVDPKLAETAPLFYRVTDEPFLPKMEQEPKLVETVFYRFWHISDWSKIGRNSTPAL